MDPFLGSTKVGPSTTFLPPDPPFLGFRTKLDTIRAATYGRRADISTSGSHRSLPSRRHLALRNMHNNHKYDIHILEFRANLAIIAVDYAHSEFNDRVRTDDATLPDIGEIGASHDLPNPPGPSAPAAPVIVELIALPDVPPISGDNGANTPSDPKVVHPGGASRHTQTGGSMNDDDEKYDPDDGDNDIDNPPPGH